jgi:hypothetical protein
MPCGLNASQTWWNSIHHLLRYALFPHDDENMGELTPAECGEQTALLDAYREGIKRHSQAVAELQRIRGTCSRTAYESQFHITEALRLDAEKALEGLGRHVADHGCSRPERWRVAVG